VAQKIKRFGYAIAWVLIAINCGCQPAAPRATEMLAHSERGLGGGIDYLLSCQADDGLWHSPNYGNLKHGAAITAFVIYAIAHCPERLTPESRSQLQSAVDALLPAIRRFGYVANDDGADYSNYGSAMLLRGCQQAELNLPADVRQTLVAYLVRAQLDADEGFDESSPDYGGWDLTGWMTGQRPSTGTNISVSATVMEALSDHRADAGVEIALQRSTSWLARCQNRSGDGGFFFHPRRDHDGNKAGWTDDSRTRPKSYGTATTDGLRAARAAGMLSTDPSVEFALQWLIDNPRLDVVPGFADDPDGQSWQSGLRYYYYYSLCQSLDWLPDEQAARLAEEISRILLNEQASDGSWSNRQARMREDDPVIATAFAVIALSEIQNRDRRD
jgi:hypothetical protein